MLKNPIVLVAIGLLVAGGVWLAAHLLAPSSDLQPLKPSPGESLRRQGVPPRPAKGDPAKALERLTADPTLKPGDGVLRDLLKAALAASEPPTWRCSIDVPFGDSAAQQAADELREWLGRKMAGLGFGETTGKPTVVFNIHVDPAASGSYGLKVLLRAAGEQRFEGAYELPAAFAVTRLDSTLAPGFAAPFAAPAAKEGRTP